MVVIQGAWINEFYELYADENNRNLEEKFLKEEGIYRKSGTKREKKELMQRLDKKPERTYEKLSKIYESYSVHDVAGMVTVFKSQMIYLYFKIYFTIFLMLG